MFLRDNLPTFRFLLLLLIISTLLVPFQLFNNNAFGEDNRVQFDRISSYETQDQFSSNNFYSNLNDGSQYYYDHSSKNNYNDEYNNKIEECEKCFLSHLNYLDRETAAKILYFIDEEFKDLKELCKQIVNGDISRHELEERLSFILFYNDSYGNYHNDDNRYGTSYSDKNEYYDQQRYGYQDDNNEYYDHSYLDEESKIEFIDSLLDCLFRLTQPVYVVWEEFSNIGAGFPEVIPGNPNDILIAKSTDGGETFGTPINISNNPETFSGFPSIAINGKYIYVVWVEAPGDILIAKSTDGGETFSPPVNISNNPGPSNQPQVFVSNNEVFVVWQDGTPVVNSREILFAKSTDGGETFSPPLNISENNGFSVAPTMHVLGNEVYIAWSDDTEGYYEIYFAKSTDGGETFSPPINISDNPGFSYDPFLSVYANEMYIAWSDDDLSDESGKREILLVKSTDGGESFGPPINVSNNDEFSYSFDPSIGLEKNQILVVWKSHNPENDDIFLAKSTDGGETFSPPLNISDNDADSSDGPLGGARSNDVERQVVVSGQHILVTWHDGTFGNFDVFVSKSDDGGISFDEPINVSNSPTQSTRSEIGIG